MVENLMNVFPLKTIDGHHGFAPAQGLGYIQSIT